MSQRFFVETPIDGERAVLSGDEARHLASVMRAAVGDEAVLFDGSGDEFLARIERIGKREIELAVIARQAPPRELARAITLAIALPKGERQKWLVEKATELGVARLVPLVTQRGVAQPVDAALDRLRRGVIEAAKQCGRNRLMEIAPPQSIGDFLEATPPGDVRLLADPTGLPLSSLDVAPKNEAIHFAIGPEGGFAPDELAQAHSAGWHVVSLGPRILRIETAAIALAAWAALSER